MELDVIAFHPMTKHLIHLEPSLDAHSWEKREQRFSKKFEAARKYILTDIFTWLEPDTLIEQIAILICHPSNRHELCGAAIISIDEFVAKVRVEIASLGIMAKNAIPEQYPQLRAIQLLVSGYYRIVSPPSSSSDNTPLQRNGEVGFIDVENLSSPPAER